MLDGMEKKYCSDFVKGLRERQEYEVLNQNGICLIRGFIADDGSKPFKANTGVRFARQTNMRLEILHSAVLQPGGPALLERDGQNLQNRRLPYHPPRQTQYQRYVRHRKTDQIAGQQIHADMGTRRRRPSHHDEIRCRPSRRD